MIDEIDKVSNSMSEYGFHKFYESKFTFDWHTKNINQSTENVMEDIIDLQPITIEQLRKPIIIAMSLNGIGLILLVVEVLLFRWKKWRSCEL